MKLINQFFYTLRQEAADEDSTSSNLLVRSGMIKKSSSGVYMFMPLGLRVLKNIEEIVREEMVKAGSQELLMPSLVHKEIYEKSGRAQIFGPNIFKLADRYERPYVLGPTHEELFAIAAKMKVNSYKDLPFNIFQFQNKFRDEPRPRYGLIRVREFIMKDAYSFDADMEGLDVSYKKMFDAYKNVFDRLGLNYVIVKADTGAMGGHLSEEFQAVCDIGEDILVMCDECDYASNLEVAEVIAEAKTDEIQGAPEEIHTPNARTIDELTEFLGLTADSFLKTLVYKVDGELIAFIMPGDRHANEVKIGKMFNALTVELPEPEEIENGTNGVVGYMGPIGLGIKVVADSAVLERNDMVTGANKKDYHVKNISVSRDVKYDMTGDVTNIKEGDKCPKCGGEIVFKKGIEVGNTFKLGTKYSEALDLEYADQKNTLHPVVMGSYGLGIGRTMAAIVEQNSDEKGIAWPMNVAPYKVYIVLIRASDEAQAQASEKLYSELNALGIDTILDDRDERAGVKFNDAELIGIPIRVTVGRGIASGVVELKERKSDEVNEVALDEVVSKIQDIIKNS